MPEVELDPLFPALPEDLKGLSDEDLASLLTDHEEAAKLIDADDEEFLKGLSGDQIIEQYRAGAEQIKTLNSERDARAEAHEAFVAEKEKIREELTPKAEVEPAQEDEPETEPDPGEPEKVEERELVMASADLPGGEGVVAEIKEAVEASLPVQRFSRKPPAPAPERIVVNEPEPGLAFVASGLVPSTPPGSRLETKAELAEAWKATATALGKPAHVPGGREDKYRVASLNYLDNFPEERRIHRSDWEANAEKIAALGSPYFKDGMEAQDALVASGGLCAPLEPIYSMPQLATDATPVEDALPMVAAERGGFNIPTPTTIADVAEAITTIEEADDALGGTFATKACLDLSCPTYTETAVTIIAACREFGNLNAMAWPEKIRHELELTRAQHAKTSENYLLERIKALSINVTDGAETLSSTSYLVDAIRRSMWGIRSRLRLPRRARFQVLLPEVIEDLLVVDTIQTEDGNRFNSLDSLNAYLNSIGIDVTYFIDGEYAAGDNATADAAQAAGALDGFPNTFQWAIFPAGTFLGMVMPELNLGVVRDSTLNSTNDFQVFWERFLNVARVGPAEAAHWHTSDICPVGQFPPDGTARTCE
jgi:hypothetical protein